jgi:hypothetical protein
MSLPFDPLVPRTLRLPEVREHRRMLSDAPHVKPLNDFARRLQSVPPGSSVPLFDPFDGGTAARILFLFEKTGPKADADSLRGSGFVSRDNDGRSAEWTFRLMRLAGVPRTLTAIWNVVPWWDGRRVPTPEQLRRGVSQVRDLVTLMPLLDTVVFVGDSTVTAMALLDDLPYRTMRSYHPSPKVKAAWASKWLGIPDEWAKVVEGR